MSPSTVRAKAAAAHEERQALEARHRPWQNMQFKTAWTSDAAELRERLQAGFAATLPNVATLPDFPPPGDPDRAYGVFLTLTVHDRAELPDQLSTLAQLVEVAMTGVVWRHARQLDSIWVLAHVSPWGTPGAAPCAHVQIGRDEPSTYYGLPYDGCTPLFKWMLDEEARS